MHWGVRLFWLGVFATALQLGAVAPARAGIGPPSQFDTSGKAALHEPYGITTDNLGNVYVADTSAHRMVKFDKDGQPLLVFGQGGSDTAGQQGKLYYPAAATYANDHLYVLDFPGHVDVFTTSGTSVGQFPTQSSQEQLNQGGLGIASDCSGNIYVSDTRNNRLVEFDGNGTWIKNIASGEFAVPTGIAIDESDAGTACVLSKIYVADEYKNDIVELAGNGQVIGTIGGPGTGPLQFGGPEALAFDHEPNSPDETLWVAESGNNRVQELVSTDGGGHWSYGGAITQGTSQPLGDTHALALAPSGDLIVADTGGNLYDYPNKPPALKLLGTGLGRPQVRRTSDLGFEVKYNQLNKTCSSVLVSAKVSASGHTFTVDKRVDDVGDTLKRASLALSNKQLGFIEKAWKAGHKVPVDATAKGICSDGVHVTKHDDTVI